MKSEIFRKRVKFEEEYVEGFKRGNLGYISNLEAVPEDILDKCVKDEICSKEKLEDYILEGNLVVVENLLQKLQIKTLDELSIGDKMTLQLAENDNLISFFNGYDIAERHQLRERNRKLLFLSNLRRMKQKSIRYCDVSGKLKKETTINDIFRPKKQIYADPDSAYFNCRLVNFNS